MERPLARKESAGPLPRKDGGGIYIPSNIPPENVQEYIRKRERQERERKEEEERRLPLEMPLPPRRDVPRNPEENPDSSRRGVIIMDMAGEEDSKENTDASQDAGVVIQMDAEEKPER